MAVELLIKNKMSYLELNISSTKLSGLASLRQASRLDEVAVACLYYCLTKMLHKQILGPAKRSSPGPVHGV